ncbi:MAG: chemotaxis protein CheA, partial [Gammaproteobacteria bacterium]|nr:chemotaxis protein CheA [Gammaproteobacteria bacterium]
MASDPHSEIFQDFLLEAGELLESLNEQLVELESNPEDSEALNAVFRGFHTIKGGAGFLELTSIVELCHRSEDLFGLIREDKLKLTEAVMDPVLAAVDELNVMFEALQEGVEPEAAPVTIIQQLEAILNPSSVAEPEPKPEIQVIAETRGEAEADENEDISEDEFEALLDRLDGDEDEVGGASGTEFVTDVLLKGDPEKEFTEDEFDLLLDTLDEETVEVEAVAAVTQVIPESKAAEVLPSEPQSAPPTPPAAVEKAEVKKPKQKPSGKTPQHGKSESSVRVDTRRLDDVMNMVGELVLIRNRFENLKQSISSEIVDRTISDLNLLTTDIQEVVMRLRMQPVRKVFSRFPRVVRDLARKLNRKVKLDLVGEETEVDKNLVEELADPLIHLIRNAVDHG